MDKFTKKYAEYIDTRELDSWIIAGMSLENATKIIKDNFKTHFTLKDKTAFLCTPIYDPTDYLRITIVIHEKQLNGLIYSNVISYDPYSNYLLESQEKLLEKALAGRRQLNSAHYHTFPQPTPEEQEAISEEYYKSIKPTRGGFRL